MAVGTVQSPELFSNVNLFDKTAKIGEMNCWHISFYSLVLNSCCSYSVYWCKPMDLNELLPWSHLQNTVATFGGVGTVPWALQ